MMNLNYFSTLFKLGVLTNFIAIAIGAFTLLIIIYSLLNIAHIAVNFFLVVLFCRALSRIHHLHIKIKLRYFSVIIILNILRIEKIFQISLAIYILPCQILALNWLSI